MDENTDQQVLITRMYWSGHQIRLGCTRQRKQNKTGSRIQQATGDDVIQGETD